MPGRNVAGNPYIRPKTHAMQNSERDNTPYYILAIVSIALGFIVMQVLDAI